MGLEPPIILKKRLQLTAVANVNGQKFDGIDYFQLLAHTYPEASVSKLQKIAYQIPNCGFTIGSLVPFFWRETAGGLGVRPSEPVGDFFRCLEDYRLDKYLQDGNHVLSTQGRNRTIQERSVRSGTTQKSTHKMNPLSILFHKHETWKSCLGNTHMGGCCMSTQIHCVSYVGTLRQDFLVVH